MTTTPDDPWNPHTYPDLRPHIASETRRALDAIPRIEDVLREHLFHQGDIEDLAPRCTAGDWRYEGTSLGFHEAVRQHEAHVAQAIRESGAH